MKRYNPLTQGANGETLRWMGELSAWSALNDIPVSKIDKGKICFYGQRKFKTLILHFVPQMQR